jgi:hypothetical protein
MDKLTAAAATAEDHLKLAPYYSAKADALDAQGAGYEKVPQCTGTETQR